jgi:hypothetical protein
LIAPTRRDKCKINIDDPEFLETIPDEAEIIFLPENDPELCEANLKLGKARQAEGRTVA